MDKTYPSDEWQAILSSLDPVLAGLLLDSAEEIASGMKMKNQAARISTNGALEVLFAIGCWQNSVEEQKGESHE